MLRSIMISSFFLFASAALQAAHTFDAATHCVKDGGFYLGCARQKIALPRLEAYDGSLQILSGLPQKLRIGYRFYCPNVTGFGDLTATLEIGLQTVGLTRTRDPEQLELNLLLQPGITPTLDVGTTKKSTRLVDGCNFELTSVNALPLTNTISAVSDMLQSKKQIATYLISNAENTDAAINRSLGYMQGRKIDWQDRLERAQKLVKLYQKKLDSLDPASAARKDYEIKLAEQTKAITIYEEELSTLNLLLIDFSPISVKAYAENLRASYEAEATSLLEYLDRFKIIQSDDDFEIVVCTLNPNHSSCGV